jgi:hypothetical protein
MLQGDTRIECKQNIQDTIEVIDERGLTVHQKKYVKKSILAFFVDNFN